MRLSVDVTLAYTLTDGDAVLLTLEAGAAEGQHIRRSTLTAGSATLHRIDSARLWALDAGQRLDLRYRATVDITRTHAPLASLTAQPMHALTGDVLTYLRPSRFCQSDLFTDFAQSTFGTLSGGAKVAAIRDWVTTELTYAPGASHGATTAVETFQNLQGVCRDYAHLVCALSRAAGIPARYTSVYGPDVTPADFHAVAEVWLNGAWHLVDATGMGAPDNLIIIASGRDAGDVAFMETENQADPIDQRVSVSRVTDTSG